MLVDGQPENLAGVWKAARAQNSDVTEVYVCAALQQLDPLWDELFPAEQARIVQLLVERIEVRTDGIEVRLRVDGRAGAVRGVSGTGAEGRQGA